MSFIFGKNKLMQELHQTVRRISNSDLPVFIEGETGTGKTLLAREIHECSQRTDGLFVYLDCATITPSLMESELFGHEKGAFTGATERKCGLFELACGGTVFLDEIETLELTMQAKLLRALEEKRFRRVGGIQDVEVHFKLISASNAVIKRKIAERAFRHDLYYRIKGTKVSLPALRERKDDIIILANHFLKSYNKKNQRNKRFSPSVESYLINYEWPGNVRELRFAVEEAAISEEGDEIHSGCFSLEFQRELLVFDCMENHLSLDELERKYIELVLNSVAFNKTRAAKIMGIGVNTLYRKIDKYGISLAKRA